MSSHVPFVIFTLLPLSTLMIMAGISVAAVDRIGEYRLLVLVAILVLMGQHQLIEAWRFLTVEATVGGISEALETGANVLSSVAVYYGITYAERQQNMAEQLEASEHRYRTLTEQSPIPILVQGTSEILYANQSAAELFGADDPATLLDRHVTELFHPDEREPFARRLRTLLDDHDTVLTAETRILGFDDHEREVVVSGGRARYEGKTAVHMVFRDVTRERELDRVQAQFRTTLESSNDAILLLDPNASEIRKANQRASELLGYDQEELIGMSPRMIHPHEVSDFQSFVDRVRTETRLLTDQLSCMTRNGETVPVEISASLVEIADEDLILASIRDISERKRREQQITVLRRILRHNLRNEMTIIGGHAGEIATQAEDTDIRDAAQMIERHANNLTSFSVGIQRLQSVIEHSDERRAVSLSPIVDDAVAEFRETYPDAVIEADVPDTITVRSAGELDWAIENLIENALEHNDSASPWVRVSAERIDQIDTHPRVALRVADNGPGIPESERTATDVDIEATDLRHGSGFGLYVVGQIVTLSGGEIEIDNYPDTGGALVTLSLPTSVHGDESETDAFAGES